MQMLMGPGTRSPLQSLLPHELPSLHPPQGLGVPSSSIYLPLHHSATMRPSSRSLDYHPYFCAQYQNVARCRKATWIAHTSFPNTNLSSTFCPRSISSAHVDLVWLSLTLLFVNQSAKCPVRHSPRIPGELPKSTGTPSLPWELECVSTHTRIMSSQRHSVIGKSESGKAPRRDMITDDLRDQ